MTDLINIGLSGVLVHQSALTTTGNNITNANVPGYSRQRVEIGTRESQFTGAGFVGSGAIVQDIQRIADQFLIDQLRFDTSQFFSSDTYLENISQLDSLLANQDTGLSSALDSFYAAIQSGVDDPEYVPSRQLVLTAAEGLVNRLNLLFQRLENQNNAINQQMENIANDITTLAAGIADLNVRIEQALSNGQGSEPNDLMDRRDELLRQLSEKVSITTVQEESGATNVFIGNGQALVVGALANQLTAIPGQTDSDRFDLVFSGGSADQVINKQIVGGELGGLVEFRDEILDLAYNELGRVAIVLSDAVNQQQQQGIDLEGNFGQNLFSDINSAENRAARAISDSNNALPNDRSVSVYIEDSGALTTSDYILSFAGPSDQNYLVTRLDDGEIVASGIISNGYPASISGIDGFRIDLESGSFRQGDRFRIQPTRLASRDIDVEISRPQELAYALPVSTSGSSGNLGTGIISQGEVLDRFLLDGSGPLPSFAVSGDLNPSVLIRFTTPTTYDVLDNSDPANPVDLNPPIRNRQYIVGQRNEIFTSDPGATQVSSDVATLQLGSSVNGFGGETINVQTIDPDTGLITSQSQLLAANESARTSAQLLSSLDGVVARANSEAVLQVNDAGAGAVLFEVSLNGENLTDSGLGVVPNPVTADFLRDRINSNAVLQSQGIVAVSDGLNLTVRSALGEDLNFVVAAGDAGDSLVFSETNGNASAGTIGVGLANTEATVGGILDVELATGAQLSSTTGRFSSVLPTAQSVFTGYQATLSGTPQAGDEFFISGDAGVSDNRNALALAGLQSADLLSSESASLGEIYAQLVADIGTRTSQAQISTGANEALMQQAQANRDSVSGVNLDEEAARLIQFQQAYNASAQVIGVARELFDALLAAIQ